MSGLEKMVSRYIQLRCTVIRSSSVSESSASFFSHPRPLLHARDEARAHHRLQRDLIVLEQREHLLEPAEDVHALLVAVRERDELHILPALLDRLEARLELRLARRGGRDFGHGLGVVRDAELEEVLEREGDARDEVLADRRKIFSQWRSFMHGLPSSSTIGILFLNSTDLSFSLAVTSVLSFLCSENDSFA